MAAVAGADARLPFAAALAHYKAGDSKAAQEAFERTLTRCREQKDDRIYGLYTTPLVIETAAVAKKERWLPLLKRAADIYLFLHEGELEVAPSAFNEARSPFLLWADELVGRWGEFFEWYVLAPGILRKAEKLCGRIRAQVGPGKMEEHLRGALQGDVPAARYRAMASFMLEAYGEPKHAAAILKASRSRISDAGIEFDMARFYAEASMTREALEAASAGVKLAESGPDAPLEEALGLYKARLEILLGMRAEAAASVRRLIDRKRATRHGHVAEVCEHAGLTEEARSRYELLRSAGYTPFIRLGRVCEVLSGAAGDPEKSRVLAIDAIRFYNGNRKYGSAMPGWPEEEDLVLPGEIAGASSDAEEGRRRMLAKLGGDVFVTAFLAGKFEPLSKEVEARAREAFQAMADPEADSDRRMKGLEDLRALGPAVTPLIRSGLEHGDPWVKAEIRRLIEEWAEPLP